MPVHAPITRDTHRWLRAVVLAHMESEPRRRHPPALHAGHPGRPPCTLDLAGPQAHTDAALRVDLWSALILRARHAARRRGEDEDTSPWLWLTRDGRLDDDREDDAWAGAAVRACTEAGLCCRFVVVVRQGWRDPTTGVRRQWTRLRRRAAGAG
jgi:hypothetical protein